MFYNLYLHSITTTSEERQQWVMSHMQVKSQQQYDWKMIQASKEGEMIHTYRGDEMIIKIDDKMFPMPIVFIEDRILSACFPNKDHNALRQFLTQLRWGFNTQTSGWDFMFDDAAIQTLYDFHATGSQYVADLGCGAGEMSIIYLIAGAKEVYAFDRIQDMKLHEYLKAAIKYQLISAVEYSDNGNKPCLYGQGADHIQRLFFIKDDITRPGFSLGPNQVFDQIWARRFIHMLDLTAFQNLKTQVLRTLKPNGAFYVIVNAIQGLWTAGAMHSSNRFIVEPLIDRMEAIKDEFIPAINLSLKQHRSAEGNLYSVIQDAKLLPPIKSICSPQIYAFTPISVLRILAEMFLLSDQVRTLTTLQQWTDDPKESFNLYAIGKKPAEQKK